MLRSIGDSRTPLIFLAIAAALNIGLDFLFILGFHTGVAGAGYASVLSQGISGILCLIYMFKKYEIFRIRKEEWKLSLSCCGRLVSIGLPMALQFSITAIGSIILQTAVNTLGNGFRYRCNNLLLSCDDFDRSDGMLGHHHGNLLKERRN